MVRLQLCNVPRRILLCVLSQFHNGSITTLSGNIDPLQKMSLNSTMVRLQLNVNSRNYRECLCLNSTMVRLQQRLQLHWLEVEVEVSIPQWFDYNSNILTRNLLLNTVSIPQWFDYNVDAHCSIGTQISVSIPQWFDYNRSILRPIRI